MAGATEGTNGPEGLVDQALIEAVYESRLPAAAAVRVASDPSDDEAQRASAACRRIAEQVRAEIGIVEALLTGHGIDAVFDPIPDAGAQLRNLDATVADAETAERAATLVAQLGYERWHSWEGGAAQCFHRLGEPIRLGKPGDAMFVLGISWPATSPLARIPEVAKPNELDLAAFDLPAKLWPLYVALRPFRLVADRTGWMRDGAPISPPLPTPASLIDPLFDFAGLTADDTVVDVGCGDGRLLLEAARRRGCKAIGIEGHSERAEEARARIAAAGVADRATVIEGDARTIDIPESTVSFLFLPAADTAGLVPVMATRLRAGQRLVAHEQEPLHVTPGPTASALLLSEDSLTVAHRWEA